MTEALKQDGIVNSVDSKNGNYPLHIAAQNGHKDVVELLVKNGGKVNAQNGTGTTPLHMALEYDYWFISKFLMENGADGSIKNEDGNTAESGIGGERTINDYVAALTSAHNLEELEFALEKLAAQKEPAIDKAALVQGGMAKKRSSKDIWSKDIQGKFMKLVQSL